MMMMVMMVVQRVTVVKYYMHCVLYIIVYVMIFIHVYIYTYTYIVCPYSGGVEMARLPRFPSPSASPSDDNS